ncbi:hypothetical protein PoB_001805600 [Plakobranchus ocellatus]|uniref:CARD domain-containing protein n=1 Tax=Plakobranchus ocellatus TaxID=259542 RepID=A0AAV3YWS6_9GAST|nr:hypothetical protein PoB_001805600 [Plakobranchus ocellatus]
MQVELYMVRAILRQNEYLLRRHLVLSSTVLEKMRANGVITDVMRRKIVEAPAVKQVPMLLNSLEDRGLHSLQKFLEVLRTTGHSWMVDMILDTDVSAQPNRTVDDSEYHRERIDPAPTSYTRPGASHFPRAVTSPKRRAVTFDPAPVYRGGAVGGGGMSLADVLKAREPKEEADPMLAPRGVFHARTMLTDPTVMRQPTMLSAPSLPLYTKYPGVPVMHDTKEDIPMTLYNLNETFADQESQNQQALCVLRQEAVAIRQLLDQNARDEANVRRKQAAVNDIVSRLRDIHHRAREVYQPAPHPNIGRYRLAQLNQIPWSIDK